MDPPQDSPAVDEAASYLLVHAITANGRAALCSKDWASGHFREEGLYADPTKVLRKTKQLDEAGRDVYIGACSYGAKPWRRADNVIRASFLYCDNDRGTEGRWEPTVAVASGTSGHLQNWYGLREDIDLTDAKARAIFQAKLRGLQRDLGGDESSSLTKVLRLPGTHNRKDGERAVTVVEFHPFWSLDYSLFPASPNGQGPSTGGTGSNLFEGDPIEVAEDDPRIDAELWAKIRDDPGEGKRNEHDLSWANSLRNRKLKAGEVFYLLLHHSRAKRPGHFEDYCRRTTATAFENERPTAGESKGEPTGESKDDKEFEREYRRQKLYRAVIRKLDEEEARSRVFELPPSYSSLAEEFLLPSEPVRHAVESLLTQGGNASLTAKYKTGKTTLAINLGAALADEEPFLGRFDCELGEGRKVGIFNYELPKEQFREWLRCLGIKRPERIAVQHLRGVRAYLDDQSVAEQMVIWLSDHSVGFWIIDNRRRAMSGLENSNDAMNGLTEAIDWIKEQAGVTNSLTLAHMGRREHEEGEEYARGATAFDDWVDARWIETKKSKTRYLFAEGRDVDLPESRLAYDPSTRRLAIVGGGRSEEIREQVLKMVKEKPGYYVKEWLCDRIRGRKQTIGTVVDECIEDGEIEKDAKGKLWPSGFEPIKVRMAKR